MMIYTHVLLGIAIAAFATLFVPTNPTLLVAAGVVGGAFPDGDMLLTHRKTLHSPVVYSIVSVLLFISYVVSGSTVIVLLVVGSTAAALHSIMDVLGGGKEMRPWQETDNRAVYNHVTGQWIAPLRVFYDGSVPDLILAISLGTIAGWLLPRGLWPLILGMAVLSVIYTLLRKAVTRWIPEEYPTFSSYIQELLGGRIR